MLSEPPKTHGPRLSARLHEDTTSNHVALEALASLAEPILQNEMYKSHNAEAIERYSAQRFS